MRTLRVGNQVIGEVEVSDDADPQERRRQNILLAANAVGRALERFKPLKQSPPDERYWVTLSDVTRTVVGCADGLTIAEVKAAFEGGDPLTFLAAMTYRASGLAVCALCGKSYADHPKEKRLAETIPTIHQLCNGDLVKL